MLVSCPRELPVASKSLCGGSTFSHALKGGQGFDVLGREAGWRDVKEDTGPSCRSRDA